MPTLNVEWHDPTGITQQWAQMDGRAFLEAIGRREIPPPPIFSLLDITEGSLGDGWIEFKMRPQPYMMNLMGTMHGGVLATLVDSALTCAMITTLPAGMACTSIDLQMRFFRPARISAEMLTSRADVIHRGKSFGTTQGEIRDARDRLIVHATSALAIAPASAVLQERVSVTKGPTSL